MTDHYELTVPDREGLIHKVARRLCWNYWGDWRYDPGEPAEFKHYYNRAVLIVEDIEKYAKATRAA